MDLKKKILEYCLDYAPVYIVRESMKNCNVMSIPYMMKTELLSEFPELRKIGSGSSFGAIVSESFSAFKTDSIELTRCLSDIDKLKRYLKLIGKYHPEYLEKCLEHDAIVEYSNELAKPLSDFLKLYKKHQRKKGKTISVIKRRETRVDKPSL